MSKRVLRFPARGGEVNACMRFSPEDLENKKKQRAKAKWVDENGTPEHGCGGGNRQKINKKLLRRFPAISDGFDLEKLKHPPPPGKRTLKDQMKTCRRLERCIM